MNDQNNPIDEPPIDEPPRTGHIYDGIEEYDNPMPGWWSWIFVLTIVFAVFYFYIDVSTGGGLGAVAAYDQAVIADTARMFGSLKLSPDAPTIWKLMHDEKLHRLGESIFQTNCISCHGKHAEGVACPNLTDDYYIHIKQLADFPDVITHGRNNGAMPAWGNRLSPNEIICVAAYVASLRNTNYPGGKKPEANAFIPPPWLDH